MRSDLAHQWCTALRSTPRTKRGTTHLRTTDDKVSPLGVLASIVAPSTPKVEWQRWGDTWALVPLVGAPQTLILVPDLMRHCRLTSCDPHLDGRLSVWELGARGMSFEHIAELVMRYHRTL